MHVTAANGASADVYHVIPLNLIAQWWSTGAQGTFPAKVHWRKKMLDRVVTLCKLFWKPLDGYSIWMHPQNTFSRRYSLMNECILLWTNDTLSGWSSHCFEQFCGIASPERSYDTKLCYPQVCCYIIGCYIIGMFVVTLSVVTDYWQISELHYRGLFCYIIC